MPQIGVYLDAEYDNKLSKLKTEGESKMDAATRLLKQKIDEDIIKNEQ